MKIGAKVIFNNQALDFGIGKERNIGEIINIRNKGKGKLVNVLFENGKTMEINSAWLKDEDEYGKLTLSDLIDKLQLALQRAKAW